MAKTTIVQKTELPDFCRTDEKEVSLILGVHVNTITTALKARRGETYEKIKKVAIVKWGHEEDKS